MPAEVEDRQDVLVRQGCHRLGLALEPRESVGVVGDRGRQNLDRHVAIELRVPRPIHLPHSTRAERREDLVRTEAGAWRKRHD